MIVTSECPQDSAEGTSIQGLPYRKPRRTWAGRGTGTGCDLCGRPIQSHQIEYEIELYGAAPDDLVHLHLDCFQHWATRT
jgi:hypothetical protein